ncbi:MAG: polyprenyl synthetase family protein [Proteobacteria bacterium]|nr:polyprenyl synthetase family protein [Pseudomonadota bacterium]
MSEATATAAQGASLAIPQPLLSTALARAEHPVLICGDAVWTAARLQATVARRAAWLAAQGLAVGDVIALLGAPSVDWVVSFHALGWLGAVAAPLPDGQPLAEQERLLRELRPQAVLADATALPGLGPALRALPLAGPEPGAAPTDGTPAVGATLPERFWPLAEPRVVIFTSGTTGQPRQVELTTSQLLFNAFGSAIRLGHDLHDRWLACLPLHHIGGLSILTRCAWLGSCVVLEPRFEAERVAQLLDTGTVTVASLVPTMLARVLDARAAVPFPGTLRAILVGGAALPAPLLDRCRALGAPLALSWGMSETASQVATRFAGDLAADHGAPPLAFTRVGERGGRLTVAGPTVREAQLLTDDLGYLDALGHVHVKGRADDVILSGGEKVVPAELEALLGTHPAVAEVAVVARPDERWGHRPVAFLVAREAAVPAAELARWCRERLAAFKVPAAFIWCAALPRTELGKIARAKLRDLAREQATAPPGVSSASEDAPAVPDTLLRRLAASCEAPAIAQLGAQLDQLRDWLGRDLSDIEQQLRQLSAADRNVAQRAAAHLLAQPGKRIRPLCVLLAGRLGEHAPGGVLRRQLNELALTCELVHAATLLHDDVIDLGTERRGAPASRMLFGNTASILAGDHLLNEALRKVSAHGGHGLLAELLDVIEQMIGAEAVQLEQQHRFDPRPELYLQIVEGKTAALFRWGLRAGATLVGLSPEVVAAAGEFGRFLGVAFQLVDDLLDLAGDPQQVGKDVLADLREGKLTWPLLVAAQRDPALAAELRRAATDPPADQAAHGAALLARVEATGALAATRGSAIDYAQRATQALQQLPESEARRALAAVVEFCLARPS